MIDEKQGTATLTAVSPLTVTNEAGTRLRSIMDEKGLAGASLRIFVSGGGCCGVQYGMGFESAHDDGDVVFESGGMTVVVDPVSITYLTGARVDYVDNPEGGAFKIDNPNAESGCGCGSGEGGGCSSCG